MLVSFPLLSKPPRHHLCGSFVMVSILLRGMSNKPLKIVSFS
jgi:hypothetical protein